MGTNESKPEVEFFSLQGACLVEKQPFQQGKAGRAGQPLVVPCLMASPLQGLLPDIELGEGDDRSHGSTEKWIFHKGRCYMD